MWIVALALRRPYTFVVMAIVILILTPITILRTPTDIFPEIDIPVVSVVWFYNGLSPQDMADRIVANSERGITTTVNDIEHMESQSVYGLGIIKVFFRPGTNVQGAIAQITAICQTSVRMSATRHYTAVDHFLQRVDYSDHPAWTQQQDAAGATTVRPWTELPANLSGNCARCRHSLSVRRQDAADSGRSRFSRSCRPTVFPPSIS